MKKTLGNERNGNTQYAGPYDVERDTNGNVFVSDSFNHRILKYDISGKVVGKWGSLFGAGGPLGYGSLPGQFYVPRQIATDRYNNVYVSDSVNHRIQNSPTQG